MSRPSGKRRRSLRLRIVVATALVTTIGMAALVLLVGVVLGRVVSESIDGVLHGRAQTVMSTVERAGDTITVRADQQDELENLVWVYDRSGRLVGDSRVPTALAAPLAQLSGVVRTTTTEVSGWRLRAEVIELDDESIPAGVVVVAVPLTGYQTTQSLAIVISVGLGLLVIVGVSLLAGWIVGRALKPVSTMARRAAEWSEADLTRRFDLGEPRDEITQLGQVLDNLLERVSRTILAEQRLTAELAHELRSPLTVIRAEAELGASDRGISVAERARLNRIVASADQMADVITSLMTIARGSTDMKDRAPVDRVLNESLPRGAVPDGRVVVEAAEELQVAAPEALAVRALAPVVDNALRHCRSRVTLCARAEGAWVRIEVIDDGPGFGDADPADLFEPGFRGATSSGAGLGLSLARRLARSAGGDVIVGATSPTTVALILPRFRPGEAAR
jgi:two-component system OmpR family sensor kinase